MASCGKRNNFVSHGSTYSNNWGPTEAKTPESEKLETYLGKQGFDNQLRVASQARAYGVKTPDQFVQMVLGTAFDVLGSPSNTHFKKFASLAYKHHKNRDNAAPTSNGPSSSGRREGQVHRDEDPAMQAAIARSYQESKQPARNASNGQIVSGGGSRVSSNQIDASTCVLEKRYIKDFVEDELESFAEDSELIANYGCEKMVDEITKSIKNLKKGAKLDQKFMASDVHHLGTSARHGRVRRDGIHVEAHIISSGKQKGDYEVSLSLLQQIVAVDPSATVKRKNGLGQVTPGVMRAKSGRGATSTASHKSITKSTGGSSLKKNNNKRWSWTTRR